MTVTFPEKLLLKCVSYILWNVPFINVLTDFFLLFTKILFKMFEFITKRNYMWKYNLIFFFCNFFLFRRCSTEGAAHAVFRRCSARKLFCNLQLFYNWKIILLFCRIPVNSYFWKVFFKKVIFGFYIFLFSFLKNSFSTKRIR